MANLGMGMLGSAATGAASGGLSSGLASGAINGLTDFGSKLQGLQKAFGGGQGGGGMPSTPAQGGQPQYGSNSGDALGAYVMQLLNNGKQVR